VPRRSIVAGSGTGDGAWPFPCLCILPVWAKSSMGVQSSTASRNRAHLGGSQLPWVKPVLQDWNLPKNSAKSIAESMVKSASSSDRCRSLRWTRKVESSWMFYIQGSSPSENGIADAVPRENSRATIHIKTANNFSFILPPPSLLLCHRVARGRPLPLIHQQ
jgi:hypothetical protein